MDDFERYLEQTFGVETGGWPVDQTRRVANRLQQGRARQFRVVVPLIDEHAAFTVAGDAIYITRRLLECCKSDDVLAFILAHEIAHHDLGHLPKPGKVSLTRAALLHVMHYVSGPEDEREADLRAVELCMAAGFDPDHIVDAVRLLAKISLDYGDIDGVTGPWGHADGAWRRARGYYPLDERELEVVAHIRRLSPEAPGALRCRYCNRGGAIVCPTCKRGFCLRHRPRRTMHCANCELERLTIPDKLALHIEEHFGWWVIGAMAAVIVLVLIVGVFMPGGGSGEPVLHAVPHRQWP